MRCKFVGGVAVKIWMIMGQWSFSCCGPVRAAGVGLCSGKCALLKEFVHGVSAAGFKVVSEVQIKCNAQCLQHLVNAGPFQHFTNKVCLVQGFQPKAAQHEPEQRIHSR